MTIVEPNMDQHQRERPEVLVAAYRQHAAASDEDTVLRASAALTVSPAQWPKASRHVTATITEAPTAPSLSGDQRTM
jgi:hypothetical protein